MNNHRDISEENEKTFLNRLRQDYSKNIPPYETVYKQWIDRWSQYPFVLWIKRIFSIQPRSTEEKTQRFNKRKRILLYSSLSLLGCGGLLSAFGSLISTDNMILNVGVISLMSGIFGLRYWTTYWEWKD